MDLTPLPFRSCLQAYQEQAEQLLTALRSGHAAAIKCFNECHPHFLDEKIPWLPRKVASGEIQNAPLELADAQLAVARSYNFRDWPALAEYVAAVTPDDSPVWPFESAVEAVINGDLAMLKTLLRGHPELVRARSTRITCFDPPQHRATLLHYIAANGVECYRQRSPGNAVDVARTLLEAGAEVDARADMYGGQWTTLGLLVSSCHPAQAGVQVGLVNTLLDFGAELEPQGTGKWGSPLMTALVFGYPDAAEALVKRGARADNLALAAGLGRLNDARQLLPQADGLTRQRALALAAQLGHADVVGLLLDAGENPDHYNPDGLHAHTTPLHLAVLHGRFAVVRLLVERGAQLDIKDTIYQSTPLGWAEHARHREIADYLRSKSSETSISP